MTAYQGGKLRLGKKIAAVIAMVEIFFDVSDLTYLEPFCGMCGVLQHVASRNASRKVIASDINGHVIKMWMSLENGWDPPDTCDRQTFESLRHLVEPSAKKGFLGSIACYGNMFMTHYRLHLEPPHRDYVGEAKKSLLRVYDRVHKAEFKCRTYTNCDVSGHVVYCDPPYKNNKFRTPFFQNFDHDQFWEIMNTWSYSSIVFISERMAPPEFKSIWSQKFEGNISKHKSTQYVEHVFVHKRWYDLINTKTLTQIGKI